MKGRGYHSFGATKILGDLILFPLKGNEEL
jgi:hypothetical protein